ncbi:signal peptidase I [Streptococcus pluranimalium]|uniref:Signal peptidase I n=1 Tax=Streptococcus pluranimalium TaxID=82348 RepID=A0A2L0D601_9STRE|nr:signal peptidase I [Streptococcus pluranimalium]AUW97227.1 signal peptidase I [Streptococcus pluranimalium]
MKRFLKEWGFFLLFLTVFLLSRWFIWFPVTVEGHSMDPTLANKEKLIVIKTADINRFDMVVANEVENGAKKQIVKRVIGLPGDTITYKNDKLFVNGKETKEAYLADYQQRYQKDKLQKTYAYNSYFQSLAQASNAFTQDTSGNTNFTVKVPQGHYYLLGDDRIVSKDSRSVGTFKKETIVGEVKFRYWPFTEIGLLK